MNEILMNVSEIAKRVFIENLLKLMFLSRTRSACYQIEQKSWNMLISMLTRIQSRRIKN